MISCKCLMLIMYIARFARQDLLRAVGALTTMIALWDEACDRKTVRKIKYINGTVSWRQVGFIGDSPNNIQLGVVLGCRLCWGQGGNEEHQWGVPRPVRPT